MYAAMGKVAIVNLDSGSITERIIDPQLYERYIGGVGLAVKLLDELIPAGADPLGPDNVLAFMSGLLTGSGSLMTGRWMVCTKSPLTGGWGDANCGGNLAPAIKHCGWDGILFQGRASELVCFHVDENGPRLVPATGLAGMDAISTEARILADWSAGSTPAIACIGPAAERLSLISGISNDGGRYAARSGVGAVMGSKRLKAIALAGKQKITSANPERVRALSKAYAAKISRTKLPGFIKGRHLPLLGRFFNLKTVFPMNGILTAGILGKWGTIYNNTVGLFNGDSPVRNWAGSLLDYGKDHFQNIDPDRITARENSKYRCYSCVIACGGICSMPGKVTGTNSEHSHKPEYETCCAFGPLLLNDDLDTIFICNDLCNRAGLDTISAGSTIAFAIECYENGLLDSHDTGGLELTWGNSQAIVALLKLMIQREGLGELLADGVARAATRIGKGSERFAVHAGGQEPGMHDSRYDPMMGVSYAADPTPGRHTIAASLYYNVSRIWDFVPWAPAVRHPYAKTREYQANDTENRKMLAGAQLKQLLDAAGGCLFALATGLDNWPLFAWLNAATGLTLSPTDWLERARLIQLARHAFNNKHGIDENMRVVHPRISGQETLRSGPLVGKSIPLDQMAENYRQAIKHT
jgi:aldehyde:ferredoxin oxidoreductase